jgi:uncharacterized protein
LIGALTSSRGSSATILKWWREGRFEIVASQSTLHEAELVLGAGWLARVASRAAVDELLEELRTKALIVQPSAVELDLKDTGDRELVAAAVAGGADYLLTADREVLMARGYGDVEFVTSGEFVERMAGDFDRSTSLPRGEE